MNLALVQQLPADGLPCAAFEEDVIGDDDRSAAVLLQQGFYMLEEVELFVGRRRPEVVAFDNFRFPRDFAIVRDNGRAALFSKRRVGHHNLVAIAGISG